LWLAEPLYQRLRDALLAAVQEFQAANPTERGAPPPTGCARLCRPGFHRKRWPRWSHSW